MALPGATPILAIDMYEHAYHIDFGPRAATYVDHVMANLNWERIGARYCMAIGVEAKDKLFLPYGAPAEELKAALEGDDAHRPVLLDVCLPKDLPRRIGHARRREDARSGRVIALGRRAAASAVHRGLLHLRISGEW